MKFLIDTDKIPYTFYEECGKSLHTDADARWLSEKKMRVYGIINEV